MQIGIDEVGRGSLAGPLVVGAVGLSSSLPGLKDSKQLSKAIRERIAEIIYSRAEVATLGWVWPHEIDLIGLTAATTLAIKRALAEITLPIDSIIIDGKFNFLPGNKLVETLVKADERVPSVSAASVIAKVARDNYMSYLSNYFPDYGFDNHVGYGTKSHISAIIANGPCVLHRLSFAPMSNSN